MSYIDKYLNEVVEITNKIDRDKIQKFADAITHIRQNKGRLFFLGVGGSAGNCSHAVNDFRKLLGIEAYAITDNVSELTARINDEGWDTCFSKWLVGSNLTDKDAIVIFSVGGGSSTTSSNIFYAINVAKARNTKVLSIVSRDGGHSKISSDVCILVPIISEERITPHAEEWQGILWHLIVNMLKESVDGN
jgi:D-sedoheptulose 7-phosphate isomerase